MTDTSTDVLHGLRPELGRKGYRPVPVSVPRDAVAGWHAQDPDVERRAWEMN